ncbi:hypothetical protein GCM10027359_29650 [Marilutibacter aestuarii]|uniref:Uncharacterized protein n=2 Tax=Marilutibacter aestuarii TaxID=1706195 RepID=A0A508A388_9GAMM|nr:hypothetical protein FKV25_11835 [Lysobacter aestuarii]
MLDELDLLREKLEGQSVSPASYQSTLAGLDNALSPSILHAKAESVRQYLTDGVYVGLGLCGELLPDEEEEITKDDFREFVGLINELELMLQDSSLPSSLVALIRRHIRQAELAVAQYPIRGAVALKDALKYAVGDLAVEADAIRSADSESANKVTRLWKKANDMADGAIKTDNIMQLGSRVVKFLTDVAGG